MNTSKKSSIVIEHLEPNEAQELDTTQLTQIHGGNAADTVYGNVGAQGQPHGSDNNYRTVRDIIGEAIAQRPWAF